MRQPEVYFQHSLLHALVTKTKMMAPKVKGIFLRLLALSAANIICFRFTYEQTCLLSIDNQKGSLEKVPNVPISPAPQIFSYDEFWSTSNKERYENPTAEYRMPPQDNWLMKKEILHSDHIPKTLSKVFLQKPGGFPDFSDMVLELKNAHASWKEKNPDHNIQYFDLKACRDYLAEYFHPVFLRAFDCLEAFASKADFFRMALIYREGGW